MDEGGRWLKINLIFLSFNPHILLPHTRTNLWDRSVASPVEKISHGVGVYRNKPKRTNKGNESKLPLLQ